MKNFFDTNDEKLTEKAFSHGIFISVLSILLCIVALCSASYAWFAEEQSSGNNTIISGSFDLDISVMDSDNVEIELVNGKYTLNKQGKYTITLTITPESTVKGYCAITINGGDKQFTYPVYPVETNEQKKVLTFTIDKQIEGDAVITFTPEWGYPATDTLIKDGDTLELK